MTDEQLTRYARHIVLKEIGGGGQARLLASTVAIVGAGGIGSPAIQYLAAAGVGRLIVIDDDRVDCSNLQRQTIFGTAEIGVLKADAARDWVARLDLQIAVEPVSRRIDADNGAELLAKADVILDGCDSFTTRLVVADLALALRIPLISAAVGQFEGQLAVYRGWEADKPCYRCFVGADPARGDGSCAEDGVLGPTTGIMGSLAALEVLRALVPFGDDSAGKLLLADALSLRFRTLTLPKDPGCPACATRP